jgi:hypothetical protein
VAGRALGGGIEALTNGDDGGGKALEQRHVPQVLLRVTSC